MFIHAIEVKFLEDVALEITFQDGRVVRYDMSKMFSKYPQLEELRKNRKLFESGYIDQGGNGIIWNDELDFDAMGIYYEGEEVGRAEITINQQIGALLIKTREEMNITQIELAKISHINQADISKIEKGVGNPTLAKISKLFKALGKNISFITLWWGANNGQDWNA